MSESGHSRSFWRRTFEIAPRHALVGRQEADVCVVGAGVAGLTVAYFLQKAGLSTIVLEAGTIGGGETERTTGHLSFALDDRFERLIELFGETGARLAAESHATAVDVIGAIAELEGIACDFTRLDGWLFTGDRDGALLEREGAAAARAGLTDVALFSRAPLSYDTGPALRFPRQGQLHPLKYLGGLAHAVERLGGKIYTRSRVRDVEDGRPARVETEAGARVVAADVVVATLTPINDRVVLHTKQAPYRSYVLGARVPRGAVAPALYWDTETPYHYARLAETGSPDSEILLVGGEDHKTGQADDAAERFARLERWTRERFPISSVDIRWSGQIMEPVDSLAFIGRNPGDRHLYVATGDSGHGMTHGTIAGLFLADLVRGVASPWATLYDPARLTPRAALTFAEENLNVALQYVDRLPHPPEEITKGLAVGEAAVVSRGLEKIAVFRDEKGFLHERSAVCTHLGCVVRFNSLEKTWDCPCHGSRYDVQGEVVNGPARRGLDVAVEAPQKR